MSNVVDTIEGTSGPLRALQIVWHTKEGPYKYIPAENEPVKIRFFDTKKEIIFENECRIEDDTVLIQFPSDMEAGDYDYEIIIELADEENPDNRRTVTLLSSKYHVSRR